MTDEEKELKRLAINPPEPRMTELKAFCRRYNTPECQLTDAERALVDGVAFDVAGENALCIIEAVTGNYKKYSHFLKEKRDTVYMTDHHFYSRLRSFFSVLDCRKSRYECRGKFITDSFIGDEHETAFSIRDHLNNGWQISSQCMEGGVIATFYQKTEVEEYL